MSGRFRFSNEILDRAERIKRESGIEWLDVAARLGCPPESLRSLIARRKNGRWKGSIEITRKRDLKIETLVSRGIRDNKLAIQLKWKGATPAKIQDKLKKIGLTKQERVLLQKENPEVVSLLLKLRGMSQKNRPPHVRFAFSDEIVSTLERLQQLTEIASTEYALILGCKAGSISYALKRKAEKEGL